MTQHRVLIVDDYPDAAEIVGTLLELLGHRCRIALTGREAIAAASEFVPDIAILDLGLPDVSGYEVAIELRRRYGDAPLFLAAMTGWGHPQDRARALAAGFDAHVLKPADGVKLREIIRCAERPARSTRT